MTDTDEKLIAAAATIGERRRPKRGIEDAGGERHAERVVDEGEEEVLADILHRRGGELAGADDAAEIAGHQRYAGALDRDVGAGAHGDADIGRGKRRRIVDAVAGHGDPAAGALQLGDDAALVLGQHLGVDLVDAEPPRHGFGGRAAVAGRHDHLQPERAERGDRLRRRRPDRIGDRDDAGEPAVEGDEHDGLALLAALGCRRGHRLDRDMLVVHQPAVAEEHGASGDLAADALAGERLEIARLLGREVPLARGGDDRLGERMLAAGLDRGGIAENLVFGEARRRLDAGELRLALGEGAGLVDDDGVDRGHALERLGVADEDAGLGAAAGRHHDRDRRGKAERAGAGDDEDADRGDERIGERRRRADGEPDDEGENRDGDHRRHEIRRDLVGEALDRRARALRLGDHGDDAGERRLGTGAVDAHVEAAGAVERAAGDAVVPALLDRQRLAGEERLVDGAPAFEHDAVDRDLVAGADAEDVADRDVGERESPRSCRRAGPSAPSSARGRGGREWRRSSARGRAVPGPGRGGPAQ